MYYSVLNTQTYASRLCNEYFILIDPRVGPLQLMNCSISNRGHFMKGMSSLYWDILFIWFKIVIFVQKKRNFLLFRPVFIPRESKAYACILRSLWCDVLYVAKLFWILNCDLLLDILNSLRKFLQKALP